MGTKRKIEIEKRETPQQRSVTCNKRRRTVFKKARDLCLLAGANVAVFVTSPAENSDVVYSFSGYSPASEIADCFLNGKLPPPPKIIHPQENLGFYWEDPDLYTYCDDVSELNIIEDRLARMKKEILDCLTLKEKGKQVVSFDPSLSPSSHEIRDESCSQIVLFDQNPSSSSPDDFYLGSSSQIAIFDQNPSSSSPDKFYGGSSSQIVFDQNPSSFNTKIQGESSSCFKDNGLWETKEENNSITLTQETQPCPIMINNDDESFWDNYDNVFGLINDDLDYDNPQTNTRNEECNIMIEIEKFFSEEELLQF